ncbi:MAG: PHB depolymerase family esterase [Bacteroidia bacterium]|nr:PHB depolymerase family esterase [Bacteroidia bacterium]
MTNKLICRTIVVLSFVALSLCSCNKDNPSPNFTTGKNNFTVTADGVVREYVVHVPSTYTGQTKAPMVIMCHGSDQDGELFYKISGWKEVGDSLNIITVFPSSLQYCIMEDGITKTTTKWNSFPGGDPFCPGQDLKDDVEFMRQMISSLESKYNIDSKRIYMVGFSSGGQFSATCAIQMSDILAAVVSCGGGGSIPRDSIYTPQRLLPVMLMFGNKDEKMIKKIGLPAGSSVPMGFDALYTAYPQLYAVQPKPYIDSFKLDETSYSISGDTNSVVVADYVGLSGNPNNVFKMAEVKGLEHEYPNGINYPVNGAIYHWNWFKNFTLP